MVYIYIYNMCKWVDDPTIKYSPWNINLMFMPLCVCIYYYYYYYYYCYYIYIYHRFLNDYD